VPFAAQIAGYWRGPLGCLVGVMCGHDSAQRAVLVRPDEASGDDAAAMSRISGANGEQRPRLLHSREGVFPVTSNLRPDPATSSVKHQVV
jgi:hypothetical protein